MPKGIKKVGGKRAGAGAPKGNKNGVGHGCPPNEGFADTDLVRLGQELLKWIKLQDSPDSKRKIVHLSQWYSEVKDISYSQWKSLIQRDSFIPYYEKAKSWIGTKILENEKFPTSYGNRFLSIYFKEIRDSEREEFEHKIDYENEKKAEATKNSNSIMDTHLESLHQMMGINKTQAEEIQALKDKLNALESKTD